MKARSPVNRPLPFPQTRESARQWFTRHGVTIQQWCQEVGVNYQVSRDLLNNRLKGVRGASHHAAVALGLKEAV